MSDEPRDPTTPQEPTPPPDDRGSALTPPPGASAPASAQPPFPASPENAPRASGSRRRGVLLAVVAVLVVVLGGGATAGYLLMRGSSEQLVGLVPDEADLFATAYLDPSAGQKVNLLALARRFPDLGSGQELTNRVDDLVDEVLAGSGLTHDDVTPWLGSQLGVSVELAQDGTPHVAGLIATTDPDASRAAMEKLTGDQDMRRSEYDGVEISVSSLEGAYAVVDEVLVVASDEATVKRAIDAAHGALPNLGDAQAYTDTLAGLPEGKLGVAYVNVQGLVERFGSETAASAAIGAGGFGELDAIDSVGMSVSAERDGIALDLATMYDTTALSEEQRDALAAQHGENVAMPFVPTDAFAVAGMQGADTGLLTTLDTIEQLTPEAAAAIDQAGVREFIEAMNGDIAVEVGPGTGAPVSGALVIGTEDPERTKTFFDVVAGFALAGLAEQGIGPAGSEDVLRQIQDCGGSAACEQEVIDAVAVGSPGQPAELQAPRSEEYQGTTIFYLDDPTLRAVGFVPAYAVVDDVGVIATSPEEIRQLIDTNVAGEDVRSTSLYTAATASVPTDESVLFLDVQAIAATVRAELPPEEQAIYDEDVAPNLEPLTAFVVGGESDERHQSVRMFLHIGGGG